MTQEVTVSRVFGDGSCEISLKRRSACGDKCEGCAGCAAPDIVVRATAENRAGARAGDRAVVETETRNVLGAAGLAYLLPVLLFMALLLVGSAISPAAGIGFGAAGLAAGLAIAVGASRRGRKVVFVVTRVLTEESGAL